MKPLRTWDGGTWNLPIRANHFLKSLKRFAKQYYQCINPNYCGCAKKRQLQYGNQYHQYPLIFHTQTWQHGSLRSVLCMDKICIFIANHRIKGFRFRPWYVEYLISGKKTKRMCPKIPSKKVYTLYILWTHPSPGLKKCSATSFSQLEILDFKRSPNVSNWFAPGQTRPRKTSSTRSFQIVPTDILLNGLLWLWLKIEMISKMIKGQSKDMQLQILCEWRQPSGFTRKVPGKDFSDPKKYWYHFYMDVMDVLKIIPKFHSCFSSIIQPKDPPHQPTGYPYFTPYRTAAERRSSAASIWPFTLEQNDDHPSLENDRPISPYCLPWFGGRWFGIRLDPRWLLGIFRIPNPELAVHRI